ncbi:MAG: HNH endonuclease, partial [Bacteroidota bacterium]
NEFDNLPPDLTEEELIARIHEATGDAAEVIMAIASSLAPVPKIGLLKYARNLYKANKAIVAAKTSTAGLRNGHLAGKLHPKTGVPFTKSGFPNFKNHLFKGGKNDVFIKPTGTRAGDFAAANRAAGYTSTPKGFTWHHHQTTGRMQLVNSKIHSQTGHTGGFSLWGN